MLKNQNVSKVQIEDLKGIYDRIEVLFDKAREHPDMGIKLSDELKELEFMLQVNWNFPLDEKCHTYQLQIPNCTCKQHGIFHKFGEPRNYSKNCHIHHKISTM